MAIADICLEATFILRGEEEAECIKGVKLFKYLRRLLDRSDDNWSAVLQNIRKVRQVWEQLGKILRREGAEPDVSENFIVC